VYVDRRRRIILVVAALAVIAVILVVVTARPAGEQSAASASASPSVSPSATSSASPIASATRSAGPTTSSATTRGEYVNTTWGYAVTLPEPYHLSSKFTQPNVPPNEPLHEAAIDVFTVLTREQEDTGTVNCHTACPTWNYTIWVHIFKDAGNITARQAYSSPPPAGYAGQSARSTLTDVTIDGHEALKIEPGVSGDLIEYIVPDEKRNIFVLAAIVYEPGQFPVPAGASEQKLRAILDSFHFTSR
jgi:hypothetical protein